jgi:GTP cyclohydrolase III
MRTTAKEVTTKIREHILNGFEEWESYDNCESPLDALTSQLEYMRYDNETDYQTAKRLVEDGQFLVYHFDVNNFMNELNINDKQKEYSDTETWDLYVHLLAREICKLIN